VISLHVPPKSGRLARRAFSTGPGDRRDGTDSTRKSARVRLRVEPRIRCRRRRQANTAAIAFPVLRWCSCFYCFAAQYESLLLCNGLAHPIVPMCLFPPSRAFCWRGMDNNPDPRSDSWCDRWQRRMQFLIVNLPSRAEGAGGEPVGCCGARPRDAPPADPDDVFCVHSGVVRWFWRTERRRDAPGTRHGRILRHARRTLFGLLFTPFLCPVRWLARGACSAPSDAKAANEEGIVS